MNLLKKLKNSNGLEKIKVMKEFKSLKGIEKVKVIKEYRDQTQDQKEKRGIHNVTFNDKNATPIRLEDAEDVIMYTKGNKKHGAKHIVIRHMDDDSSGGLTHEELLDLGVVIREGDEKEKDSSNGQKVREYTHIIDGIRFRAIVSDGENRKVITYYSNRRAGRHNAPSTPSDQIIQENDGNVNANIMDALETIKAVLENANATYDDYKELEASIKMVEDNEASLDDNMLYREVISILEDMIDESTTEDAISHDGGDLFGQTTLDSITQKERTFRTYKAWKSAVKKIDQKADFTGDEDIDQAFKKEWYSSEWDSEKGRWNHAD